MNSIGDVLKKAFPSREAILAMKAKLVLKEWQQVAPGELGEHSVVQKFKTGRIYVVTSGASWSQELIMKKAQILEELNRRAKMELFTDIRVTHPRKKSALAASNADPTHRVKT